MRQEVAVVMLLHLEGVEDHLLDFRGEVRVLRNEVLLEHRQNQLDFKAPTDPVPRIGGATPEADLSRPESNR